MMTWIAIGFSGAVAAGAFFLWRYLRWADKNAAPWFLTIAMMVIVIAPAALATDRALLLACEHQLGACYEGCKAKGNEPKACSEACRTRQCGLPWNEAYGAFLDRRIEEETLPHTTEFVSLTRLKVREASK